MANTIITKNSATATAVPTAGQLVQGELAVNVTDKRLFTENSGGTVVELGTNPSQVNFADNAKAIFGTDSDLQIYHDGSNSYVSDVGAGNLNIQGNNLILEDPNGVNFLGGNGSTGAVTVYYNGSAKLATTSTGVDVTGTVVADSLNVGTTSDAYSSIFITSSATGESELRMGDTDTDAGSIAYTNSNDTLTFRASAAARMTLASTGIDVTGDVGGDTLTISGAGSVQGLTVGRGAGAVASNTAVGTTALATNTSGAHNVAVGNNASPQSNTGSYNIAVGENSLFSTTSGSYNTAVGQSSLLSNTTAGSNTAVGYRALYSNTSATINTAVGTEAAYSNTTGGQLVAIGYQAAYSNTTGPDNVAVGGYETLFSNTTGGQNIAIGRGALKSNTTASNNTAVGYQAAYSNTTGTRNAAFGIQALYANTVGTDNTAIGRLALTANTASANTAIGSASLYSNISGANNTSTGEGALFNNTSGARNTASGGSALFSNTTAANNTAVGYQSGYYNSTGTSNVFIGGHDAGGFAAGLYNTTGSYNTMVGAGALKSNTTADANTALGYQAAYSQTTGALYTVAVGYQALKANTSGATNNALGFQALTANTAGSNNNAFGSFSLANSTTGNFNTAFGDQSLRSNTTGAYNVAVGTQALQANTSASNNTALGFQAGFSNTTGDRSVFVGTEAGYSATGYGNTCIGYKAGNQTTQLTTGIANILLGPYSKPAAGSDQFSIVIGWNAVGKGSSTGIIGGGDGGTSAMYQGNNSATWSTTSDQRLKKNIVDNTDGLSKIASIRVRNFEYRLPEEIDAELNPSDAIKRTGVQLGVIAQELQEVLPECVKQESTGVLSVDTDNLVWYLVNSIQELKAEIELLKGN